MREFQLEKINTFQLFLFHLLIVNDHQIDADGMKIINQEPLKLGQISTSSLIMKSFDTRKIFKMKNNLKLKIEFDQR